MLPYSVEASIRQALYNGTLFAQCGRPSAIMLPPPSSLFPNQVLTHPADSLLLAKNNLWLEHRGLSPIRNFLCGPSLLNVEQRSFDEMNLLRVPEPDFFGSSDCWLRQITSPKSFCQDLVSCDGIRSYHCMETNTQECANVRPLKRCKLENEHDSLLPSAWVTQPANAPSAHSHSEPTSSDETLAKRPSKKIVLTSEQATEIYRLRTFGDHADSDSDGSGDGHPRHQRASIAARSQVVAAKYDVDAKTIRDIWNRKTWVHTTKSLWTPKEAEDYCRHSLAAAAAATTGGPAAGGPAEEGSESGLVWEERLETLLSGRTRGRPKGSKDSKPRKNKKAAGDA